ncbi:hypothetical protein BGZ83_007544 [Gryganskiella cystojenkinii]|nr:hypothetical protein BGZ83_007544 [Gryganskiella cystojenkinii]
MTPTSNNEFLVFWDESTTDVSAYSVLDNTWSYKNPLGFGSYNINRTGYKILMDSHYLLYLPNGCTTTMTATPVMCIYTLNSQNFAVTNFTTTTMPWAQMPIGTTSYSFVYSNLRNSMLLYGGTGTTSATSSPYLFEFLPLTSLWTNINPPGPSPASDHTKMILFGGVSLSKAVSGSIFILDLKTLSWTQGASVPTSQARFGHVCATNGDSFLAWGGQNSNLVMDNIPIIYNIPKNQWMDQFLVTPSTPTTSTQLPAGNTTTPVTPPPSTTEKSIIGPVVGGAIGGIIIIILVGACIYKRHKRKLFNRSTNHEDKSPSESQPTSWIRSKARAIVSSSKRNGDDDDDYYNNNYGRDTMDERKDADRMLREEATAHDATRQQKDRRYGLPPPLPPMESMTRGPLNEVSNVQNNDVTYAPPPPTRMATSPSIYDKSTLMTDEDIIASRANFAKNTLLTEGGAEVLTAAVVGSSVTGKKKRKPRSKPINPNTIPENQSFSPYSSISTSAAPQYPASSQGSSINDSTLGPHTSPRYHGADSFLRSPRSTNPQNPPPENNLDTSLANFAAPGPQSGTQGASLVHHNNAPQYTSPRNESFGGWGDDGSNGTLAPDGSDRRGPQLALRPPSTIESWIENNPRPGVTTIGNPEEGQGNMGGSTGITGIYYPPPPSQVRPVRGPTLATNTRMSNSGLGKASSSTQSYYPTTDASGSTSPTRSQTSARSSRSLQPRSNAPQGEEDVETNDNAELKAKKLALMKAQLEFDLEQIRLEEEAQRQTKERQQNRQKGAGYM